ncbi:hypothetical protein OHA70_21615 [Kribbella sp. NBC_00382]
MDHPIRDPAQTGEVATLESRNGLPATPDEFGATRPSLTDGAIPYI